MARHNFTEVQEPRDFSDLPKGLYPIRVVKVETGWDRSGAREWIVHWAITEDRYRDKEGVERELKCAGRTIRDWMRFDHSNDLGYGRVKHIMAVVGVEISDVDDEYPEILLGRECWGPVVMKEKEVVGRDGSRAMRAYPNLALVGFQRRDGWQQHYQPVPPSKPTGFHQAPGAPAIPDDPFGESAHGAPY